MQKYTVKVTYSKYVGGTQQYYDDATAELDVYDVAEPQARGRAKDHVKEVVGENNVGDTEVVSMERIDK